MVLKLAFRGRLAYCRNEGYRTADLALPFKALGITSGSQKVLVEPSLDSANQIFNDLADWNRQLDTLESLDPPTPDI